MNILTLLALAVALGTDAFSLCVAIGLSGIRLRMIFLISSAIFLFHIMMPLLGWLAGDLLGGLLGRLAALAGAVLLIYLGVKMTLGAIKKVPDQPQIIVGNHWGLLFLCFSVSIDALSVGFTLGTMQVSIILAALVFGAVAGGMSLAGLLLGKYVQSWVGDRAQLGGGLILMGIGLKLFF